MKTNYSTLIAALIFFGSGAAFAKGPGTGIGGGLLGLETPRSSALGEAYSSVSNDISAMGYNPASLGTMSGSQVLFSYDQGAFEDSRGSLLSGFKINEKGSLGLAVARYDAGDVTLYDGVSGPKTVSAQEDLLVNLGYGYAGSKLAIGGTIKYLTSTLANETKGSAYAVDLGANIPVTSRMRMGFSVPVISSKIQYASEKEELPRVARAGLSYQTRLMYQDRTLLPMMFLVDVPYSLTEKEARVATGVELGFGPMSIRAGYQSGNQLDGFSIGTGFSFNNIMMDYSFGFVNENNVSGLQKVSVSYRFKSFESSEPSLVRSPKVNVEERRKTVSDVLNEYRRGTAVVIQD